MVGLRGSSWLHPHIALPWCVLTEREISGRFFFISGPYSHPGSGEFTLLTSFALVRRGLGLQHINLGQHRHSVHRRSSSQAEEHSLSSASHERGSSGTRCPAPRTRTQDRQRLLMKSGPALRQWGALECAGGDGASIPSLCQTARDTSFPSVFASVLKTKYECVTC